MCHKKFTYFFEKFCVVVWWKLSHFYSTIVLVMNVYGKLFFFISQLSFESTYFTLTPSTHRLFTFECSTTISRHFHTLYNDNNFCWFVLNNREKLSQFCLVFSNCRKKLSLSWIVITNDRVRNVKFIEKHWNSSIS
jgi:hypothetical protein